MVRSILWFRQDLRLHDNEALVEAVRSSDELIPVFIFNPGMFASVTEYGTPKTGWARTRFLIESIHDLRSSLQRLGSNLVVRTGKPEEILFELAAGLKVQHIYCNRERTRDEVIEQDSLEQKLWTIGCELRYSRGKMLYYTSDLPFPVTHTPDSFAIFKKEIEHLTVRKPLDVPGSFPVFPKNVTEGTVPDLEILLHDPQEKQLKYFQGGESAGLAALKEGIDLPEYFLSRGSSWLSPWIAMGCLSPKSIYHLNSIPGADPGQMRQYLIHRDYLRLMGKKYGDRIFFQSGVKGQRIPVINDEASLMKWQQGNTGVDIIDAGMNQLNKTGWVSESIKRLLSGYFMKILQLDWRLGAAYFESRVIDYDPCFNWVSWLNMAGIGPDTREDRIINYDVMGRKIDPDGSYILSWKKGIASGSVT